MKAVKSIFLCLIITLFLSSVCLAANDDVTADSSNLATDVGLTQSEKEFISAHPVIKLGVDPAFVPYEFIDSDSEYKGITADYIKLICGKIGLKMVVTKDLTWSEAYEKAVLKEIDVLPCVAKTVEREKYFLFSNSYYTFRRVIFVNDNNTSIKSFEDLKGKVVAVQANSSHQSYLSAFDTIALSPYTTVGKALQAVSDGTETAFVGNLATSSYFIKSNGIANLSYLTIDMEQPEALHFAVRSDWPELVSIINKALNNINQEEKIAINNKWIGIEKSADYSEIIKIAKFVGAVIVLALTVSLFWIFRLKNEIVERKTAQEQFRAAKEEAEQANQIKSLFLARMSHEIRTPLSAILGMAYLIKKTEITVTQGLYIDKLNQAARNMLGIINDILDFSKIEAGKIEIERISFDLDKVLQRIINIMSAKVEERGIEFSLDKAPDMPLFFFGDPVRLEQILLNLVNNAVKFTEKGSVKISVQVISKNENTYNIEFCIKDTGIGMNPEQLERLWIPFDQGDSSINRRFSGTGLGLSIVKSLSDLMGGELEVRSVFNQGSSFYITLPLEVDLSKDQADSKKMAADCFANIRAIVLDNSENANSMLADYLKAFGITAVFTSSEDETLALLRASAEDPGNPKDLLIVDFMTPEGGGIKFYNRIKELSLLRQMSKYILLIPMTRDDLFEELEKTGIDFGISKPIIPSALYNSIIEAFQIIPPKVHENAERHDVITTKYPYHILLVEDNKINQYIAQSILEQAGFRVSMADNGEAGYKLFVGTQKDLDLILMDIHMPVMDGYTAADLIREIDADIPIVAMTADAISGVEEKCKNHGMDHYVSKPFEPEEFIETIIGVLDNKQAKANTISNDVSAFVVDTDLLNTADGIRRLGGNADIYKMILQEFYKENSYVGKMLDDKVNTKNYDEAVQIVHKIKSSAGNIGAKSLSATASELQKALQEKNEAELQNLVCKFHVIFDALLNHVDSLLKK